MDISRNFGFYGILTDPDLGYEALAALMVERGVRYIQLRMKGVPPEQVHTMAQRLRPLITSPSLFIVNDDPHIAAEVGADGVHLGQGDMPLEQARAIVGPDAVIGLSTHNPAQVRAACALGPDYIGMGPVYATPTKAIPDPVLGLDGLAAMLELATVPAVAIGGIDLDNAPQVLAAGARNLCAVRCITRAEDAAANLDAMMRLIEGA